MARVDALFKLRILIWTLIIGLWGVIVYQYLGEEEGVDNMKPLTGLYKGGPRSQTERLSPQPAPVPTPAPELPQPPAQPEPPPLVMPVSPAPSSGLDPKLDFIKPLPPRVDSNPALARLSARPGPIRRESRAKPDLPVPPGFVKSSLPHFNVYCEGSEASEEFLHLLENLHGNLMLDLAAFSPWAADEKVSIFLFKNQDTYRKVTGRPAWSGGATSVPKRKIYIYESDELTGILAHELCHVYYDGFFLGTKPDPLWLSEGMATLIQIERGLAAPNWLKENLDVLRHQGGYSMADLMHVDSTSGASDENVRLWYTQSYSVVRFLIRSQYKSSFYNFSRFLRDGKPVSEALYRAYGMPYTNLKALEYAWRYDVTTNGLSNLGPAQR